MNTNIPVFNNNFSEVLENIEENINEIFIETNNISNCEYLLQYKLEQLDLNYIIEKISSCGEELEDINISTIDMLKLELIHEYNIK